jgi:hypothetical protein
MSRHGIGSCQTEESCLAIASHKRFRAPQPIASLNLLFASAIQLPLCKTASVDDAWARTGMQQLALPAEANVAHFMIFIF